MRREIARLVARLACAVLLLYALDWHAGIWRGVWLLAAIQLLIYLTPCQPRAERGEENNG